MDNLIQVSGLTKAYPNFKLGPLDLILAPGEVVGFAGANGAGKSTTMKLLAGLLKPDGGDLSVLGFHPWGKDAAWKADLGFLGERQHFYEGWTGARNLAVMSRFFPNWSEARAFELARRFELDLTRKARNLSPGNRVKLALVAVLARSPKLLVLDEPTGGLDPVVRSEVLDTFWEVMEEGERAILYSTHLMSDLSKIADRVVYIHNGQTVSDAHVPDLLEAWRRISIRHEGDLPDLPAVVHHRREGSQIIITTDDRATLTQALGKAGITVGQELRISLEEISVAILKQQRQ